MNKLTTIIPFSLAVGLFIIGIHQVMTIGITESYWIFMLSLTFLFLYQLMKKRSSDN